MNRLLLLAAILGAGYVFLVQSGSPILRQMHVGSGFGGSLNPVMGAAAGGSVGGAAVKAAARVGG